MKTFWIVVLISVQVLLGAATGTADTIYDYRNDANNPDGKASYWGGYYPINNEDAVPGQTYLWDITKMVVTETDTKIRVQIFGPWFGAQDPGWFFTKQNTASGATQPWGGGLYNNSGDLYINSKGLVIGTNQPSSPYYPDTPNFKNDTFTQSEGWDYVITFRNATSCDNFGNLGCYGNVYKLDYSTITKTTTRTNQAYAGGYGEKVQGVSVYVYGVQDNNPMDETNNSYMMFEFDKFLTGNIGLHYTMYCGNDVIEGDYTMVPEPGTMLLLGFALAGLGVYRRVVGR